MKISRTKNFLILTFACLLVVSKANACDRIPYDQVDIARTYLRIILDEYPAGMNMPESLKSVHNKAKGFATLRVIDDKFPGLLQGYLMNCEDDNGYQEVKALYRKLENNYDSYYVVVAEYLKTNKVPLVD